MSRSPVYHCGHLNCVMSRVSHPHASNLPPADFAIDCNTLVAAIEQPDVTSCQSNSLALACNWSIEQRGHHVTCINWNEP